MIETVYLGHQAYCQYKAQAANWKMKNRGSIVAYIFSH